MIVATITIAGVPAAATLTSRWTAIRQDEITVLSVPTTDYGSITFDLSGLPAGARITGAAFACQVGAHMGGYTIAGSDGNSKEVELSAAALAAGSLSIRLTYRGAYRGNEVGEPAPGNQYSSMCRFYDAVLTVDYDGAEGGGGGSTAPAEPPGPLIHGVSPGRLGKTIMYYPPGQTDFGGNGRALRPVEARIEEEENGNYAASMTLTMEEDGPWREVELRGLLRIPCPETKVLREGRVELQGRDQIFRIHDIRTDMDAGHMQLTAQHIFYDLSKVILVGADANMQGTAFADALARLNGAADHAAPFAYVTDCDGQITGDYRGKNLVECLLDPDSGMIAQLGAHISRDNYTVYILKNTAKNRGVRIQHGRNILGAVCRYDAEAMGNRIVAGMGDSITIHDDPDRGADDPVLAVYRSYQEGGGSAAEQAAREFENGLGSAEMTMDVNFVLLTDTAEYTRYAGLQKLILGDLAHVTLQQGGYNVRMTGYVYNSLLLRYEEIHIGPTSAQRARGSIPSYQIGGMDGSKLEGDVDGEKIRNGTITTNKITSEFGKELDISSNVAINLLSDAMQGAQEQISRAMIRVDGVEAQIILKAEQGAVDALGARLAQAEIDIDGAEASILLKASQETVTALAGRLAQAEIDIDGANAQIALKASQATVDELGERVTSAELRIDGAESLIEAKADLILLEGYVKADELETEVLKVMEEAWAAEMDVQSLTAASINTNSLSADSITADELSVGGFAMGTHSHAVSVAADGTITLGEVSSSGGSFNIADTSYYKNGVSAAIESVTLTAAGWESGNNVITASNGKSVTVSLPAFSASGGDTWSSNKTTVYFYTDSVAGPLKSVTVDASSVYSDGYSDGKEEVTLSAGGWQSGNNVVSASNGKSVTVTLPSFSVSGGNSWSSNKTTVYFYTASVSGALASKTVDASSVYDSGYSSGRYGVTLSEGSWSNNKKTIAASNGKSVTVDATEIYDAGYAAGVAAAKADTYITHGTLSITNTAANYFYGSVYVYAHVLGEQVVSTRITGGNQINVGQ